MKYEWIPEIPGVLHICTPHDHAPLMPRGYVIERGGFWEGYYLEGWVFVLSGSGTWQCARLTVEKVISKQMEKD